MRTVSGMRGLVLLAAVLSVAVSAGSSSTGATRASAARTASPATARPRMEAIVRAWSARLNAGDYAGIARLFRLPATVTQGPYVYRLSTARQVALWHRALPCGGKVTAVDVAGPLATATFRLANRRGSKCDAPGGLAAAQFTIVGGKITAWRQVAVPPPTGPVA